MPDRFESDAIRIDGDSLVESPSQYFWLTSPQKSEPRRFCTKRKFRSRFNALNSGADGRPGSSTTSGVGQRALRDIVYVARQLRRGIELNFSIDNMTNRDYYETQNYFESRVSPMAPVLARIHGTPGCPLRVVTGVTFRLLGK